MSNIPSLEDLLKKGVHFGHKESKWHPNMAEYIYTSRNGVHILDLSKTQEQIKKAIEFVKEASSRGKHVMVVGTKKSHKALIQQHAQDASTPFVSERWLGGTITNFKSIYGLVQKLDKLEKQEQASDYEAKYNKKERLDFTVEMNRLKKMIGGIRKLESTPDILFVSDIRSDKTAVTEAKRKNIPIVAIVDSNVDPTDIDCPIPANDDSIKSVDLIISLVCQAIATGKKDYKPAPAKEDKPEKKTKEQSDKPSQATTSTQSTDKEDSKK